MSDVDRPQDFDSHVDSGFTLLEMLVVIAVLGILLGYVGPAALRQLGGAKNSVARQNITRLGSVLDLYKFDVGEYPTTSQGVAALSTKPASVENWNGPYLQNIASAKDPWSRNWTYRRPFTRMDHEYDLCSLGPNGEGDGSAKDEAICNP